MRANLDHPERFVRIVLGLVAGNLGFANPGFSWLAGTGPVQVAAVILGAFLLVTGLVGFCPLRFLVRRPGTLRIRSARSRQIPGQGTLSTPPEAQGAGQRGRGP